MNFTSSFFPISSLRTYQAKLMNISGRKQNTDGIQDLLYSIKAFVINIKQSTAGPFPTWLATKMIWRYNREMIPLWKVGKSDQDQQTWLLNLRNMLRSCQDVSPLLQKKKTKSKSTIGFTGLPVIHSKIPPKDIQPPVWVFFKNMYM